jgi:hypothetical protein
MTSQEIRKCADKSLAFPISYFQHNHKNSFGGIKSLNSEVISVWSSGGEYVFFPVPKRVVFFIKPKNYHPLS